MKELNIYIEVDCHLVRDKVQDKVIKLFYTPTHTHLTDLLTKALSAQHLATFATLLTKMSNINIHSSGSHLEGVCENARDQKKKKKQM